MIQSELLAEFRQSRTCCLTNTLCLVPVTLPFIYMAAAYLGMGYAVLLLAITLLAMIAIWRYTYSVRILLYPDQLVRSTLLGKTALRLNARTEFYYYHLQPMIRGILLRQPYITLKYAKKSLTLDSGMQHVDILRDALLELEQIYQKPVTEHALLNRRSIFFGELKVSATGLVYRNQALSYQDVKDCSLQKGHFKVLKQKGKQTAMDIPVSKIPNIKTFFAVLDYYMAR